MANETAIAKREGAGLPEVSVEAIRNRIAAIEQLKKEAMREGEDYGVIPGCKKPSLYQAGAQKLCLLFGLGAAEPIVEDLGNGEQGFNRIVHYRLQVPIINLKTHAVISVAVAECSSEEEKYKWRGSIFAWGGESEDHEYQESPEELRRKKWKKGKKGASAYQERQIRMEPTTLANTMLAMAHKRAYVRAVVAATAAGTVFTHGAEDLPEGMMDADVSATSPTPAAESGAAAPQQIKGCATSKQVGLLMHVNKHSKDLFAYLKARGFTSPDPQTGEIKGSPYAIPMKQFDSCLEWAKDGNAPMPQAAPATQSAQPAPEGRAPTPPALGRPAPAGDPNDVFI